MSQRTKAKSSDTTSADIQYSIIVPAYREASNIPILTGKVFEAFKDRKISWTEVEMIVVDDNSRDGTVEAVQKLQANGYPVRVIVRTKERGLSSAVLRGFNEAQGDYLLCMDADLQHPPQDVPKLFDAIRVTDSTKSTSSKESKEFSIGTRYGGQADSIDKDWPLYRRLISSGARLLARPLTPLSDPMTGFFALRKSTYERGAGKINPIGFKICLELYVKCRVRKHAEVPIRFGVRVHGESKLSSKVIVGYLKHLYELYSFVYPGFLVLLVVLVLVGLYILNQILLALGA